MKSGRRICSLLAVLAALLARLTPATVAQRPENLTITTDAVGPIRFLAAHGQRTALMGYAQDGLEMWAYPVQVLSHYRIGIRPQGATSELRGELLLRRVEYEPRQVTRVYVGVGESGSFVVRKTLFVPSDRASAILTYETEGRQPVDIAVHFTPVLDLMWPAGIGGQYVVMERGRISAAGAGTSIRGDDLLSGDDHARCFAEQYRGSGGVGLHLHPTSA